MTLRNMRPFYENTEKGMEESIPVPELQKALHDFIGLVKDFNWVLIGDVATSVYTRPRVAMNLDILVPDIKSLGVIAMACMSKFKRSRGHTLEHKQTGVEIELLAPSFLKIPSELAAAAIANAREKDWHGHKVKIVDPQTLAHLKILRGSYQDLADIENLIKARGRFDARSMAGLTAKQRTTFGDVQKQVLGRNKK